MHKKLFKCGNSMALTIDAFTRRSLAIDETTLLHVTREGQRIVIEKSSCNRPPVVEPTFFTATTYDRRLLNNLILELDGRGLDRYRFASLSHDGTTVFSFHGAVELGHLVDAVTVSRVVRLAEKLRRRTGMDQAIAEVLTEVPGMAEPVQLKGT